MALLKKIGWENNYNDNAQFKELRKEFDESKRILEEVGKNLNKFLEKIDDLLKTQGKLSNEILQNTNYSNATPELLQLYKSASDLQMRERDILNHQVRTICLDPLNKYKAQYREIQERLHEYRRLGEEVEKLGAEHRNAKKKNSALVAGIERRLNASKQHHGELYEELSQDIFALVNDRNKFLEPLMGVLFNIQLRFYQGEHNAFLQFANHIPNIQAGELSNHPRVIRSRKDSISSRSYTTVIQKSVQTPQPVVMPDVAPNAQCGVQCAYLAPNQINLPNDAQQFISAALGYKMQGVWNFDAQGPSQLSFKAGDQMVIIAQPNADWWLAEMNGVRGYVPSRYVTPV